MASHRFQQYVGIPFKEGGRDRSGIDCWGLLRLVGREQFGYELPSYDSEYEALDTRLGFKYDQLRAFSARHLPEWTPVSRPSLGNGVLMRVMGSDVHVGIVVDVRAREMLHIEKGCNAVIEAYDSLLWKGRVSGFYRYNQETAAA